MATSGDIYTTYFTEEYGSVRLKYHWAISGSQSIDNNTTTIAWTITTDGTMTSGYWYKAGPITMTMTATNGSFTSGSNSYSNSSRIQLRGGGTQVAAGTAILTHNATGVGSFSVSMSAAIYYTSTNVSGSGTASLPTIPRATTPVFKIGNNVITEVDIGTEFTIELPRASDSFTHTVKYSFGSLSNESIGTNLGASTPWTPQASLGPQIPNSTSGVCTITCETYSGQTLIGTTNKIITLKAPASWVPTNTTSFSSTKGALGYIDIISAVNAAVTYGGSNGSTVTSVSLTFQGKTYEGTLTENGTSVTITSDLCSGSGNAVAVKTRVTDSRGRYTESSSSLTVLAYSLPSVTLSLTRTSEANGTNQNETGSYMRVELSCSVASITGNSVSSISASYKIGSGSSTPISISSLPYDSASGSNNISVSNSSSCTVTATITDTAGGATTVIKTLPVGFKTLDFLAGGKGINIGSTAVNENLAINRDIMLGGKVYRKNFLKNTHLLEAQTIGSVVYTPQSDGGILVNGSAGSSNRNAYYANSTFVGVPGHKYILSGCPAGGEVNGTNYYALYIARGSYAWYDKGTGVQFTYPSDVSNMSVIIRVYKNQTCDNKTFYPMIRDAGITDSTWEPYISDTLEIQNNLKLITNMFSTQIGDLIIRTGSVVFNAVASQFNLLFTFSELDNLFGTTGTNTNNCVVYVHNGHYDPQRKIIDGVIFSDNTYPNLTGLTDGAGVYIHSNSALDSGSFRANYIAIRFTEEAT